MAKGRKTGGRQKGTPNRTTRALKEMICEAFAKTGGVDYLVEQSKKNPVAFMALIGRVLPLQVKDGGDEPRVPTEVTISWQE